MKHVEITNTLHLFQSGMQHTIHIYQFIPAISSPYLLIMFWIKINIFYLLFEIGSSLVQLVLQGKFRIILINKAIESFPNIASTCLALEMIY